MVEAESISDGYQMPRYRCYSATRWDLTFRSPVRGQPAGAPHPRKGSGGHEDHGKAVVVHQVPLRELLEHVGQLVAAPLVGPDPRGRKHRGSAILVAQPPIGIDAQGAIDLTVVLHQDGI